MIGIIDINTGNIASLSSALRKLDIKFKFCREGQDFHGLKKFILPGVGAYKDFMNKLKRNKFDKIILEKVNKNCSFLTLINLRSREKFILEIIKNHPSINLIRDEIYAMFIANIIN